MFHLITVGAPHLIYDEKKTDQTLRASSKYSLDLEVSGLPLPTITWKKDGQPIDDKSMIDTRDTFTGLTISKVTPEHSGQYTVTAENSVGRDYVSFILEVKGKRLFIA